MPDGIQFDSAAFLVVHFAPGTNDLDLSDGRGDIYANDSSRFFNDRFFDNRNDACGLWVGIFPSVNRFGYADIVAWNLKNLSVEDRDSNAAVVLETYGRPDFESYNKVQRIQPKDGLGPLLAANPGVSIGRDRYGSDPEPPPGGKNIAFVGGVNAAGPTMGDSNFLPMAFNNSGILSPPTGNASWTLMLYMAGDYGDELTSPDRWYYDLLNQIERVIPVGPDSANASVDSVNVAVLFDSRRTRLVGDIAPQPTSVTFEGALRWDTTRVVRNLTLIPTSVNTGDSITLSDFISQAINNFPASQYALALKGDGAGWQGLCGDATSMDRLEMGELKSALQSGLGATKLDLLIFDAPLMSQLEVAAQVKDFAHIMVASPEMTGPADFDYPRLVRVLKGGPSIAQFINPLQETDLDIILKNRTGGDLFAVWAVVNLDSLDTLIKIADNLSINLNTGVEDRCQPNSASDNYQLKIRAQLDAFSTDHYGIQAQGMADYTDLRRFALGVRDMAETGCQSHKAKASDLANLLRRKGPVITGLEGGGITPGIGFHRTLSAPDVGGGLSIYFPSARQRGVPLFPKTFVSGLYQNSNDHPYDRPGLETEGGVSQERRIYAADFGACYPHSEPACETADSSLARNHPFPPVANFAFTDSTHWDEFLIRYYKPVADAGGGLIDIRLNQSFDLSAATTSDADDPLTSLSFFWDVDANDNLSTDCLDYQLDDLDKNCLDNGIDEPDLSGQSVTHQYSTSGVKFVWLHVWDPTDNALADYSQRRFQTSKDSVKVQIQFRGILFVWEDGSIVGTYSAAFPPVGYEPLDATDIENTRKTLPEDTLTDYVNLPLLNKPHVVWATGSAIPPLFPDSCQKAIDRALTHDDMGILVFGPGVADDSQAKQYFDSFGFAVDPTAPQSASFIVPDSTYPQHFLFELGSLALSTGTTLHGLNLTNLDTCIVSPPLFPILKTDAGKVVAAARITDRGHHAIVYFTFDLGSLANPSDRTTLLERTLGWLASPTEPTNRPNCPPPPCVKGNVNRDPDNEITAADIGEAISLVFHISGAGGDSCAADVNCDTSLTATDLSILATMVFLQAPAPCSGLFRQEVVEAVEQKVKKEVDWLEEK